ncbi:hypothetical protein K3G39_19010 [Pontibacter sp. HSC-14F20]|uniref:lanthionine synthetase LanC family protein n=1 Tax=Pontibacter sp. HSC-14F20 TaxID=2864136 RepID=UPI001C72D788|nr:lanthionine synthetase LanC family protein [Pontibacter sp. HSC-14F20]MBX0335330.1 hypothetical protein [Pontibacter sp. HSC-14F20]
MVYSIREASVTVEEIAGKLVDVSVYDPLESDALYMGNLGKVVSLLTLSEYYQDAAFASRAVEVFKAVTGRVGDEQGVKFTTAMSNGLSGFGYVLMLMQKSGILESDQQAQSLLDWTSEKVYEKAKAEIETGDLDPMYSAVGGLYFLSKSAYVKPSNAAYSIELVQLLESRVQENAHGKYIANRRYQREGTYVINTGLAHGICGMILVLVATYQASPHAAAARQIQLLLNYLKQLYKPYSGTEEDFLFPRSVTDEGVPLCQPRKLNLNIGWCTSDLSIAYAFLKAGDTLKHQETTAYGNLLLSDFLKFDQTKLPVYEANFCHGFAGFSWLFTKCYELTNRLECLEAAQYWLRRSLANPYSSDNNNLLDGSQGVYNVILQSTGMKRQQWDEVFFL